MKTHLIFLILLLGESASAQYQPHMIWDRSGLQDSSAYGTQILPLGDQNDDGYADWAVVGWGNRGYDGEQPPVMEFFHGAVDLPDEPYMSFQPETGLMRAVETGDVDGDGYVDWMAQGSVFFGGPDADLIPDLTFPTLPLGTIGDFNGDGYSDLHDYDFQLDILSIYYGGIPMDTLPDWTIYQPPAGLIQTIPYAVGDFNGDGASDFMCYNPNPPFNLAVFLGGENPDTVPAYFWSNMSFPTTGVDSMNGDGADAFVRGTPLHFGRPQLSPVPDVVLNTNVTLYACDGKDFNGDGFHDLIMWNHDTGVNPFGALTMHLGGTWINPNPVFMIEGATPPYNLRGIYSAAGLGDVNGDGLDDFAVGVWNETFGPRRGRCVILGGDTLRVSANPAHPELPQEIAIEVYPNPFNAETTLRMAFPPSARAQLTIYDIRGRELVETTIVPLGGYDEYVVDAAGWPAGIYFARIETESSQHTAKLLLLK